MHDTDDADHAAHLVKRTALAEGIAAKPTRPVLHGDNGSTLKATTVLAMLHWLQDKRSCPFATMLRVHLMQNWFALSDPAVEEALYEIASLRNFAGLDLREAIPDETTILNFRHLLEEYDLAEDTLKQVNAHLTRKGLLLERGSIVDATIIAAPSSTKTPRASAIRRCIRRRRATSGTSA